VRWLCAAKDDFCACMREHSCWWSVRCLACGCAARLDDDWTPFSLALLCFLPTAAVYRLSRAAPCCTDSPPLPSCPSSAASAVFRCYDPNFQPGSLDEASLDVTDCERGRGEEGTACTVASKRDGCWGGGGGELTTAGLVQVQRRLCFCGCLLLWRLRPHPSFGITIAADCAAHGVSGEAVAAEIRRRVQEETRLTCSGAQSGHIGRGRVHET